MKQDIFITIMAVIGIIGALVEIKDGYDLKKELNKKQSSILLLLGVSLFLSGLIGSCIVENTWDLNFIIGFLTLKKVRYWFFRYLLPFAYLLVVMGVGSLLVIEITRRKST